MQGHVVHVVGVGEGWGRELPGLVVGKSEGVVEGEESEGGKMKIAWRYERLGEVGGARGGSALAFVFLFLSVWGVYIKDHMRWDSSIRVLSIREADSSSASDAESWPESSRCRKGRTCARNTVLPYLRSDQTPHPAPWHLDKLHPHLTHIESLPINNPHADPLPNNHPTPHNPSPHHPHYPLPSPLSPRLQHSNVPPPFSAQTPLPPPHPLHAPNSHAHPPPLPLPPHHRSSPLDRTSQRRRPRARSLPSQNRARCAWERGRPREAAGHGQGA